MELSPTEEGGDIHTHVEVRDGKYTGGQISKDTVLSNSDPTSYWESHGYTIK